MFSKRRLFVISPWVQPAVICVCLDYARRKGDVSNVRWSFWRHDFDQNIPALQGKAISIYSKSIGLFPLGLFKASETTNTNHY